MTTIANDPSLFSAHPSAPDGLVQTLGQYSEADFPTASAVLCRNTAPLVGLAYGMLQRDLRCYIAGRDIGASLIKVVKNLRARTLAEVEPRLGEWLQREVQAAIDADRNPERFYDQAECIRVFLRSLDLDSGTLSDLVAKIELMFSDRDTVGSIRLSTIHKAKGLEWPTVFILDRDLCPSRFAKLPWQRQQERNLMYVAITRAQERLVYIRSDRWKE